MLVDEKVLAALERYVPLAPLHQPNNLAPIRALRARRPELPQVACFDTAFHRGHDAGVDHYAGMLAAALGGIDGFVFTAGIGENSATMRARMRTNLSGSAPPSIRRRTRSDSC